MKRLLLGLCLCLGLVPVAAASAAEPYVAIKGVTAPGPAKDNVVHVLKIGPAKAKNVLVLVPGFQGGAGMMAPVSRDLVKRVPNLQIWAVDRRENVFEDTSGFTARNAASAAAYYLGFKYKQYGGTANPTPYVKKWGLATSLGDIRKVILAAKQGGRRVFLGGHSLGASTTDAYAAWDFNGHPGYKDVAGLVLIDGGLGGFGKAPGLKQTQASLTTLNLAKTNPFSDLLGLGIPSIAGVFAEVGALYADTKPNDPSGLQANPVIPSTFKPPVPATNLAGYGYVFDASTAPKGLDLIQIHAGHLATTGNPRGWVDGEYTSLESFAHNFAAEKPNALEWYFPQRLSLDIGAANALAKTPAANLLGVREWHAKQIDRPFYVFETKLSKGGVFKGAKHLIAISKIKHAKLVKNEGMSHLDPLEGRPAKNTFLKTVIPFLKPLLKR
jgi:pimeloyl-ACP methyl ester carboxylesterase